VNPWSIEKVTDFQRNVRVMRKLENGPDARMGRNSRVGSEPPNELASSAIKCMRPS